MKKANQKKNNEKITRSQDMKVDSFTIYKTSEDGQDKIIDGEKYIQDFKLYGEEGPGEDEELQ